MLYWCSFKYLFELIVIIIQQQQNSLDRKKLIFRIKKSNNVIKEVTKFVKKKKTGGIFNFCIFFVEFSSISTIFSSNWWCSPLLLKIFNIWFHYYTAIDHTINNNNTMRIIVGLEKISLNFWDNASETYCFLNSKYNLWRRQWSSHSSKSFYFLFRLLGVELFVGERDFLKASLLFSLLITASEARSITVSVTEVNRTAVVMSGQANPPESTRRKVKCSVPNVQ